jgi:DNA-binding CsgD family transcriptional regulator
MYLAGKHSGEIGEALGISKERVCQYLRDEIDMIGTRNKRWTEKSRQRRVRIAAALQADRPRSEAAAELGMTLGTLMHALKCVRAAGFTVPRPTPRLRDTTAEILRRYEAGESADSIAPDLGMRLATVRHLLYIHLGSCRRPGTPPYQRNGVHA